MKRYLFEKLKRLIVALLRDPEVAEALGQRRLRQELSQCVKDFRYMSESGHHREYASRRSRQILETLDVL
jgi:hypothetical protein